MMPKMLIKRSTAVKSKRAEIEGFSTANAKTGEAKIDKEIKMEKTSASLTKCDF
jgi:hypothetical protein